MNLLVLDDTAVDLSSGTTPFLSGREAVFVNQTAGALIVQGSDDDGDTDAYTTYVTVPANGMIEGTDLPNWIKVSTEATVNVLGGP